MLNKTSYLSGLTKQKEIEIYMESHRSNLRHMRSMNHNELEANPIGINKNKAKYLENKRVKEINLENELLTQKIEKIVNSSRNPKYFSSNEKYSKSLNGHIKRVAQSQVNQENFKLLVRLEESKPTYSTKKYLEQFEHLQQVEKKMSTAEFYLTESPTFRKRKLNTNKSFLSRRNSSFGENSSFMGEKNEIVKETVTLNDGKIWEIKIYKDQKEVKITGEIIIGSNQTDQNLSDLKLIGISNIEANLFLRKHCDNRLNYLIRHLKVDQKDGSLILIVPQSLKFPSPSKLMNPEQKGNIEKKLMNIELNPPVYKRTSRPIFNTVNKKSLIEGLQNFKSESERHSEVKKYEESVQQEDKKNMLPKIESKREIPNKKDKIVQKVNIQENKQKDKTKKSSVSSIKSSEKGNKQVQSKKESEKEDILKKEQIKIEKQKVQVQEKEQKIQIQEKEQVKEQEQEKYEQQNFEESMNNKSVNKKDQENVKQESIKDQHQVSVQKIEEIKQKQASIQGEDKIESSMQTPIEESVDKKVEEVQEEEKKQSQPAQNEGQKSAKNEEQKQDIADNENKQQEEKQEVQQK